MTKSTNVRYTNWHARENVRRICVKRVADGEPCAICGQPIDLSLPRYWRDSLGRRVFNPDSMEIDEIVPVSLGGSPFDPSNVNPTHRRCNQLRGNRPLEWARRKVRGVDGEAPKAQSNRGKTSREW